MNPQPTPIDAPTGLALIIDLYGQLTETQRTLADTRTDLANVTAELTALRDAIREEAGVPDQAEVPDAPA